MAVNVDEEDDDDNDVDKSRIIVLLTLMQQLYFILKLNTYIHIRSTSSTKASTVGP